MEVKKIKKSLLVDDVNLVNEKQLTHKTYKDNEILSTYYVKYKLIKSLIYERLIKLRSNVLLYF